jgi:hypothetical protein
MRTRSILLVVAILLVAGFAALNWSEIVHPTPLSFGLFVTEAPLGAILLGLLAITLVLFLASTAAMRTQSLLDYRNHQKTLEAQRELADKAEASRFVELRQHLDDHLNRLGERDSIAATEFDKAMLQSRREMQTQMEQINRTIAARLSEMESRLEGRLSRAGVAGPAAVVPPVMRNEPIPSVARDNVVRDQEQAMAREEERLRDERIREENELRREEKAADRPNESGWRKWF